MGNNSEKVKEKEDEITKLRNNQDITLFLTLIEKYKNKEDSDYMKKTLEALDEKKIIEKYKYLEQNCSGKIQIIRETLYGDNEKELSKNCLRKLVILLFCYEKSNNNYNILDEILKKLIENNFSKDLLFDILLDYRKEFGKDILFEDRKLYKEFVDHSIKKGQYLKSLDYLSNDIFQLKILNEQKENIFKSEINVTYDKLNVYDEAFKIVQDLIQYEKGKKKFIFFPKQFWENFYNHCIKKEQEEKKIQKLVDLYNLLLSYRELGPDDSEYKEILEKNIHENIKNKIEEISVVKDKIELLLKNDPYYIYDNNYKKRDPEIFEKINICELKKEEEIEYFHNIDIEKIYVNSFKNYLNIIIKKIEVIEDFNSIIKLTNLNIEENRKEFINLLNERYNNFNEDELTDESFINFFGKVIEYTPNNKIKLLEDFLPRFKQNINIYLKIIEKFNTDNDIQEKIATFSEKNLEVPSLVELIKNIKGEPQKEYFNNLKESNIEYEDFLKLEETKNLTLLTELMKNIVIPESLYLERNKDKLNTIYDKLSTYDEKRAIYLDTILNEKKEIQEKYVKRFELFKLIKDNKFDSQLEFNKIKDKYLQVKKDVENAYKISHLLPYYFKKALKEEIDIINSIYNDYSIKDNKVNIWINKEDDIVKFIKKYEDKANLIKVIKEIKLFIIIYSEFTEGEDEIAKFDKAKKLLDECKIIFTDIYKGNKEILDKWQNKFKKESGIDEELNKLKNYYKINDNENLKKIAKNIFIFTKKNIYNNDIKYLLNFLKLFEAEETQLSKTLEEKKLEFEDIEHLDFEKLEKTNKYLEDIQIYINDGKEDSPSIQLIRLLNNKENEINFVKKKDVDSAAALLYRLNPTTDSLKFKDILEYQSCIDFINDIKEKVTDDKLLTKLREKLAKDNTKKVLNSFKNYFIKFGSIKLLDENFDSSKDIYQNIKNILNNSQFKIEFFKREFKVYDDNKEEIKTIAKDLDGLIQLKDNINLNFEELPNNNRVNETQKNELDEKKKKIELFVRYVEQLQCIIKFFSKLENKGCPFLIDIIATTSKDTIIYELVNNRLKYRELIFKLKDYCNTIVEYQLKFYKENEYFRFVYDKQLYRLFKRKTRQNKDISSYVRFFTNGDSIKDDVPSFVSDFSDQSLAYQNYREAIKENFEFISKYIENIFKINDTSLEKLYKNIQVNESLNLKGIYKCNIQKYNVDLFIIKMFLKLTGTFPIAQNILLTNNETSVGEIYSFMYRSIKCRFNTLFIISISDDFSIQNVNIMTNLLNQIIRDMKKENNIKEIMDLKPCILFITHNQNLLGSSRGVIDFPEVSDLPDHIKGDENKLEYNLGNDNSSSSSKSFDNEIFNSIKVYTSDSSGLGKSELIKKDIKENGEDYHYFGIGDDITKDALFKKLKRFLKYEIKGKYKVAVHLDLFYTKNIPLMQYFLFAFLITKLYQANDNILYIPKKINIYVEVPNGPQKFLDDFPILEIFKRTNISLNDQRPLEIKDENILKKLTWNNTKINNENIENIIEQNNSKENPLTYIEKKICMNIIYYLSPNKEEDKEKYEKVKNIAKYFSKCVYSQKLRKPDISQKGKSQKEIKEYIFDFLDFKEEDALKIQYDAPLIFKTKNGYEEIKISEKEVGGKNLEYFLSNLKKIMSLDESIEEIKEMIGEYKVTEDNYKKMILILFRIFTNIPVILMGETGCGKTELIKQLMKMLNKGDNNFLIIKNMHSGVKEEEIIKIIDKAEEKLKESKSNMICVFFDEINTTSLLSKMKEIFVSHSLNGKTIDDRIRFIGACNPFRKKEENESDKGLNLEKMKENGEEMTYLVNPLPNSLLYYIFYFKSLEENDVKKYIESIIGEEFPKGESEESENSILRKEAIDAIFKSHKFVREKNGKSSVSLRDLQRFKRAYKFFNEYYKYKLEFMKDNKEKISDKVEIKSKIQSFVLSLFITYFIKIFKSGNEDEYLRKINDNIKNLADSFKIEEWTGNKYWLKEPFKTIIREEEDFLLEEMEVKKEKGIGLNTSLKENIFLMFFSIYSHIPLIVVGKPGCSKSLSIQLNIRIMRGEFSNSNFLKKYPTINSTGFQGSETNTPESIENIFLEAEKKIDIVGNKILSLLVFDELGLSERSPTNCLKVLHSKLEMSLDPNEQEQLSFIGISNWQLDAAKMNRAIFLAIPDIKLDDIGLTVKAIAKSYDESLYEKYEKQYEKLGKDFFHYKGELKKLNDEFYENFHGSRDLYHLVKIFSFEMIKCNKPDDPDIIDKALKKSFARNLSGLEINGENTLKKYIKDINFDDIKTMDLIKDNIISKDSRFLLLISEKSMFNFLMNIIKKELEEMNKSSSDNKQINYVSYIGSPFKGDRMNISYQTEMIVNIENSVAEGKVIILSNLDQIYSIFYDLFNQNYIIKDNKKYCRISHGANIQKLALVNENTKFIILVDKNDLRKQKLPFLSRFEKHIITFDVLLDEKDKEKSKAINNLLKRIVSVNGINYNMDSILVNTNEDIINGYVYLYKDKERNTYKNIIEDKIAPIIPQDIIFTLPFSELSKERNEMEFIKNIYSNNRHNSLEEYLKDDKRGKEDILIVYTFSKIGESINLFEKEKYMEKIASEIKNVFKFKQILNEFYEKKEYKSLILKFNGDNAAYINFFISEINHYKEINKRIDDSKKYIFTINIQREFKNSEKVNKITTVLITDEKIKQLFIDNINGTEISTKDGKKKETKISIKDIEGKSIDDYISKGYLDTNKLIIEGMLKFYGENNNEQIGKFKGIDTNNFIKEFQIFIENSDDLLKDIKKIILSHIGKKEKIINSIIETKSINQNTIDFISAILIYIKEDFLEKLQNLLRKSENNNFFTTLFMLNVKEKEKGDSISSNQLNDYSFNKSDEKLLKNELFKIIKKEVLHNLKEEIKEEIKDNSINIKLYYKIPGFFNIYRGIKNYIKNEKLSFYYRQDEVELRKCEYGLVSQSIAKLKSDIKEFADKLYAQLISNQLVTKVAKSKITDENYIEFTEVFLNDYITFYLVNLYNNIINDFVINDVQHKIILLLLDLKFKNLKEEEKFNIPLQNVIAKILWLEGNANYIKDILNLYNIISENIVYDEKEEDILFKEILNYISNNKIIYKPKEFQLEEVNIPYYILTIILFKCMIDKKSINNATSRNDNYYSYFKDLERCLKEMKKLDKTLKLDIRELSVLNEFITIYNVFEHAGKINKLDINELINSITKSLQIIENNEENKISLLCENLKKLILNIKETLYDSSKIKEIKGDKVYYELISNIFLNELKRENNLEYKIYILKEFLLEDEKLFIQSIQLLKLILEDFVTSDINLFQGSLDKLSSSDLNVLEDKINNDWIKETLIYTFEQISIIYIENLINDNEKKKKENKQNILLYLKSFFVNCINLLEKLYKDPELKDEEEKVKLNINLKKLFALSFIRVYLKIFIDWIDKEKFEKNKDIKEIIKVINEETEFRKMIRFFIYKILYNLYQQDISKLFEKEVINKYYLDYYNDFDSLQKEKNIQQSFKHIVFVEAYNNNDDNIKIFKEEFELLTDCLNNSGDKENELNQLIIKNQRNDIFYSVFSTKISAHLSNSIENDDKINLLSKIIHNIFGDKEKLTNIFDLFLDKSKYNKAEINSNTAEILQFSLKFCINSDDIKDDYDNMYYPLYSNENNINSYIPGNDIKDCKIYDCYSKIRNYLEENPSNYGVYVCTCNINEENKEIYIKFEDGSGFPKDSEKCPNCGELTGNDGKPNSFYERKSYYRIFKNEQDLENESKNKGNGNCITLENFFKEFISEKIEKDSKGINISKKSHFDKNDKPIRNQSQLGYRLMNLILYSHLFTNVLLTNKDEIFTYEGITYLDYIKWNWEKIKKLLEKRDMNIYIFMNLIYEDLFNYLNKQKQIEDYDKLLEVEKEIENLIENKILKKTEKRKDKVYTKYALFANLYLKNKDHYREKDQKNITSIIKEINKPEDYDEKEYPYYKSFLYSDYPDEDFLKNKFKEISKEKYPVIDLYLNREKYKKGLNKEFICFNFVIKSLLNQYSNKISRDNVKKLTFEKTSVYKEYKKTCDKFIEIIYSKNKEFKLTKESKLEYFLINGSTEIGKLYKEIYNEYANTQNDLLNEIIKKINIANYEIFECQEINIQEAQRGDLLVLEFENKSDFMEILLTNTYREFYNANSKIKYNNYNLFSIDFDKIEKLLEDILIRNACLLKTDEIVEMKFSGEDFLNDGISEFDINIKPEKLDEKDKKSFISFYKKYLEKNLVSCLEINEGLKNIITYVNKNFKNINNRKSISNIINEGGFTYNLNNDLKSFLNDNTNIIVSKLSNLMIYLENLYFELAMKERGEYKEKLDEETKNKIDTYYKDKSGQLITKDKLSPTIIRFLLNIVMNQKNDKDGLVEVNDNLLDYLSNQFFWDKSIYEDSKFSKECGEYKDLGIYVKNTYDFYSYIANDSKEKLEKEMKEILEKISFDEKEKLAKEKQIKREEERKNLEIILKKEEENEKSNIINMEDDEEIDDLPDA